MSVRTSAGLLVFRRSAGLEVLLGHMGGPFWARKDQGAWTIPKGEPAPGEQPLETALREFAEELGVPAPSSEPIPLGDVRQSGGKVVTAWAVEGDLDVSTIASNLVEIDWPPRSGRTLLVPELDRAGWFAPDEARRLVVGAQAAFVDRLEDALR
ncbi:NUDIX domain-containing protein [Cellulomonas fengjieae]|uniref:NUDIX domain-containing protein n=1 Tax=Cellulomonas fengjieae TaxID=2819978 RepID=A0ABS3SKA9_9CELL|nr:NUDIX domain-containing protein [Cellulomonas fengjieae]MBO3086186.1 NUDIX domain-containing protein [Cellulomonas fengjieae]QVI68045.1 NUDIX domain-containing protein [Cellulomonas fengjieae]